MTRPAGPPALGAALACADRGWPVFPCQPGSKQPATRHGFKDATTDPGRIRSWWLRQPAANLAIATGTPGPDVLDIDDHGPAGNGYPAFRQLRAAGLLHGTFALIATPGGGLHAYLPGTAQPSARLPRHHLDLRAAGGYILAPPSVIGGRPYRVIAHLAGTGELLDWDAVLRRLRPQQPVPAASRRPAQAGDPARLIAWTAQLAEGNRNSGLFWAACRLIEAGHHDRLPDLAAAAAAAGLPEREITRTISSATRTARIDLSAEITP
jgi:hypothetical protein